MKFLNHNEGDKFKENTDKQFLFISVSDNVLSHTHLLNKIYPYPTADPIDQPKETVKRVYSWIANSGTSEFKQDNSIKFIVTTTTYNEFFYKKFCTEHIA